MKHYDMKAYQKKIKHEMDDGRYQHTLGVMYTCAALAMRYEYDIQSWPVCFMTAPSVFPTGKS